MAKYSVNVVIEYGIEVDAESKSEAEKKAYADACQGGRIHGSISAEAEVIECFCGRELILGSCPRDGIHSLKEIREGSLS